MHALLAVAHPDDELLFAGALLLEHPEWDWTIVAATGGIRESQFHALPDHLAEYGVRSKVLNVGLPDVHDEVPDMSKLAKALSWFTPDLVVTHGPTGEYGHPHHVAVHDTVAETFPGKMRLHFGGPLSVDAVPAKRDLFDAVYPGVRAELESNMPDLIPGLFKREHFMGNVREMAA